MIIDYFIHLQNNITIQLVIYTYKITIIWHIKCKLLQHHGFESPRIISFLIFHLIFHPANGVQWNVFALIRRSSNFSFLAAFYCSCLEFNDLLALPTKEGGNKGIYLQCNPCVWGVTESYAKSIGLLVKVRWVCAKLGLC